MDQSTSAKYRLLCMRLAERLSYYQQEVPRLEQLVRQLLDEKERQTQYMKSELSNE